MSVTVYLNNTDHGRMMNIRLAAKATKQIRMKRESEIANGTYQSAAEKTANVVASWGEFTAQVEQPPMFRNVAQDLFSKYVPLYFSLDDTKKCFERLELEFVHYFKDSEVFKLVDECNKTIYCKITRTGGVNPIKVQRMKDEWLKQN